MAVGSGPVWYVDGGQLGSTQSWLQPLETLGRSFLLWGSICSPHLQSWRFSVKVYRYRQQGSDSTPEPLNQ